MFQMHHHPAVSWLVSALTSPEVSAVEAREYEDDDDAAEELGDDDELGDNDDNDTDNPDERVLLNEVIGAKVIYPQEQGELQFNLEPSYRDRRHDHLGYTNLEIEIGATDWLQFELNWDAPMIRGGTGVDTVVGFGDFELATQFTWMNMGGSAVSAAFSFEAGFPTARPKGQELDTPATAAGDSGPRFGEGTFTYRPFVTLAVDFPDARGQVFTNLGAELSTEEQLPLVNVGVFVAKSIVRPVLVFGWTLEEMYVTPGMTIVAGPNWEFAIGVPIGLNQRSDRVGFDLLIIYEFNPLKFVRH